MDGRTAHFWMTVAGRNRFGLRHSGNGMLENSMRTAPSGFMRRMTAAAQGLPGFPTRLSSFPTRLCGFPTRLCGFPTRLSGFPTRPSGFPTRLSGFATCHFASATFARHAGKQGQKRHRVGERTATAHARQDSLAGSARGPPRCPREHGALPGARISRGRCHEVFKPVIVPGPWVNPPAPSLERDSK